MKKAKEKGKEKKASLFRKNVFCEKGKCWYTNALFLAFVLFVILALASSICPTASAGKYGDGCPYDNWYNGTIHGGIYFQITGHYDDAGATQNYTFENVPDGRKIVRFYPGIWLGSRGSMEYINWTITINGHTDFYSVKENASNDPWCNALDEPECKMDITGCGVCSLCYNASPYIVTGTNNISFWTSEQIYHAALLVIYEDESMPEIQYWVKEGGQIYPGTGFYEYFNETVNTSRIYPGSIESVKFWSHGHPHCVGTCSESGFPTLNGNDIDAPDYVYSYDANGNIYEGSPPGKEYTVFGRWNSVPSNYLTRPNNLIYYPNLYDNRLMAPVLMLNYSEPSELNVTNLSPSGLYADPDETGRYANGINATVVNNGGTANFFNLTFYANNTVVDVKRITNLGEGESKVISFLWAPNATGTYELNVTADVENVVKETDETNNSKTLDVEVTEAPPPEWQSQSSSASEIPEGGTIELRAQGKAGTGLHNATLATDETGTWENITDGRYGSPMDMASYDNYSITHTTESDWNNQTLENLTTAGEDVKLYQLIGTDNLALDKDAYAKSTYGTYYPPAKAVDGDNNTFWRGPDNEFPNWWKVDLGEVKEIKKIYIDFYTRTVPCKYEVLISNDNETWTKKIEKSVGHDETYTGLDWSCRYINISIIDSYYSGTPRAGINEFEAYGAGNYTPNGTLTSKTIETSNPVVTVTPEWNSTEPAGTTLSVNISVDNGATWKNATNGTELTWDYNVYNTSLKYRVLLETTDGNETPVLHDITLNYTTRDPVEGEWLWSNFTWQNASIPEGTTVGWKIYYEDILGQTNCTDVMTFEVGALGYKICGYTDPAADKVNFTNLNKSEVVKDRPADYIDPVTGFYNLTLNVPTEVEAGNVLRIVACEEIATHEHNCNVSNHVVVNAPGEDTNVNLTLDHYCLNWMTYPYKTWEQTNWSGPAVMQMMVDHYRPLEPTQSDLNATGIAHNQECNADLLQVDPQGMRWTLNNILHNTTSYGGGPFANYGIGNYDTVENALWYICYWQYLGPGAAPTYGNYSNWMAIRGIHTNVTPKWKAQGSYDIYGFWINDPKNPGGIGENTYKSVDQWTSTYHLNLTDVRGGDSYLNRYVAICEPPEQDPGEVRLVHSKARFSGTIIAEATDEELTVDVGGVPLNQLICNRKLAREKENKVVQAAIDGVNEQLAFDYDFKKTFDGTVAGKPMPVKSDAGEYYLVPFGIESDGNSVLAVVIVDSDGGKFKEASWVNEPVKYLPVTAQEALKIVYKEMKGKSTVKVLKKEKATGKLNKADVIDENVDTLEDITYDETEKQRRKAYLELVYQDKSPYYPVWKITIGDSVFFVDQSGTLTTTPTPTPKSIEPVLQIVE